MKRLLLKLVARRENSPKERRFIQKDSLIMYRTKLVEVRVKICACRRRHRLMTTTTKNPCAEKTPMAIWEKRKRSSKSMVHHRLRLVIDIWTSTNCKLRQVGITLMRTTWWQRIMYWKSLRIGRKVRKNVWN